MEFPTNGKNIEKVTRKAESLTEKLTRLQTAISEKLQLTVSNVKAEHYNKCNEYIEDNHHEKFSMIIGWTTNKKIVEYLPAFEKNVATLIEFEQELAKNETKLLQDPENLYEANQRNDLLAKINSNDNQLLETVITLMCYHEVRQAEQLIKIQRRANQPIINTKP